MIGTYDDLCEDCRAILEERERIAPRLPRLHQMWVDQYLLRSAMCLPGSLYGTAALAFRALARKIPGGFAECGVGAGVHPAAMHYCMRYSGEYRNIWLFDSFKGIPKPTAKDIPSLDRPGSNFVEEMNVGIVADGVVETSGRAAVAIDEVRALLRVWGAKEKHLRFVPGWFHETLPKADTGPLALLRVDADVYESTKTVFDNLYERVSPGGYVLVHDWNFAGVRAGVKDSLGFEPLVHDLPETGPEPRSVWWEKE
jgi:hypothetical protein